MIRQSTEGSIYYDSVKICKGFVEKWSVKLDFYANLPYCNSTYMQASTDLIFLSTESPIVIE